MNETVSWENILSLVGEMEGTVKVLLPLCPSPIHCNIAKMWNFARPNCLYIPC